MKSNIATAAFLLLCILVFGFGMNSCGGAATKDRFAYTDRNFDAKISGNIDGKEFSVILKNRPNAAEDECATVLSFESPASLNGLVLSRDTEGICEARLYELILQDFKADGLFEPFLSLLYSGEISSVKKTEKGDTVIRVNDATFDLEYTFPKGYEYPYSIKGNVGGREIELFIKRLDFIF